MCLILLFTYKVLKPSFCGLSNICRLIPLFTYKVLKLKRFERISMHRLIPLFTYKVLKPQNFWTITESVRKGLDSISIINHASIIINKNPVFKIQLSSFVSFNQDNIYFFVNNRLIQ